jgi:hypothetical protein
MITVNGRCEEEADSDTCPENCSACGVSGNCAWCDSGYYMENGVCKQNPENCSWYNVNEGKCGGCNSGYGIIGGSCAACPENCNNCNENGCTGCINGYYAENGVCKQNPEGCSYYNATTRKCTSCVSGYYGAKNGICRDFSDTYVENCLRVALEGCVKCAKGFKVYLGQCLSESEPCPDGTILSGSETIGYYCDAINCKYRFNGTCIGCTYNEYTKLYNKNNKCVTSCGDEYIEYVSDNNGTCVSKDCVYNEWGKCRGCKNGIVQNMDCVSRCMDGYVKGVNTFGYEECFPAELGCGYGEKQVGDECVAREDGEGCGVGFYLKDNLCVSESKGCGDGYLGKDGVCISSANGCGAGYKDMGGWCNRIQYTPAEAAKVLRDGNTNEVTITFRK